nr:uncharacterized protein LOC112730363 [Arachis hypogaea]
MANEEQIEDQGSDMEDAFSPSDFQSITKLLIQLSKLQHFLTRRNKQNQMPVNPYMNSLYYLHPGENPGALIVNVTLNPSNYHACEISQSAMWSESAHDVWNDLSHRYHQGDVFRVAELEQELYALKQGDFSITTYFIKIKAIWEELDNFQSIPSCSCGIVCCGGLGVMRGYWKNRKLVRLLRGLNEEYSHVRSQIMILILMSNVNTAFSMLTQQER